MKQEKQVLNYSTSQEDTIITFPKNDVNLVGHTGAGYMNDPIAGSRVGGRSIMLNSFPLPPNNGAVLTISQIIKAVMSSAAEA